MFGIATRSHVQIGIVAKDSGSLHKIALIIFCEFLQSVEGLLIDQISLLDPALDSTAGPYPREALLMLQTLDAVSVFHLSDAVVNGRNLVAQPRLRCRHVGHLKHAVTSAIAGGKRQ